MDLFVLVSLVVAGAALLTAHLSLAAGLLARDPWWRSLVSLVAPPLAPYWGYREGMRVRAAIWAVTAVAYAALHVASARIAP